MTEDQLKRIDEALDIIRPEAKEYVQSLDAIRIKTTKDNYGEVLAFLSKLQKDVHQSMASLFLIAMVGEGYPLTTATQLSGIMGWPTTVEAILQREYLKVSK